MLKKISLSVLYDLKGVFFDGNNKNNHKYEVFEKKTI
jgi:hypothetical protein